MLPYNGMTIIISVWEDFHRLVEHINVLKTRVVLLSVSGTCRIPKRLLYTVRESVGFMGCIPVGRS